MVILTGYDQRASTLTVVKAFIVETTCNSLQKYPEFSILSDDRQFLYCSYRSQSMCFSNFILTFVLPANSARGNMINNQIMILLFVTVVKKTESHLHIISIVFTGFGAFSTN